MASLTIYGQLGLWHHANDLDLLVLVSPSVKGNDNNMCPSSLDSFRLKPKLLAQDSAWNIEGSRECTTPQREYAERLGSLRRRHISCVLWACPAAVFLAAYRNAAECEGFRVSGQYHERALVTPVFGPGIRRARSACTVVHYNIEG